jgi:hypothetical protein
VFPLAGFFSKDEILAGTFGAHPPGWPPALGYILWFGLSIAALGTAFYMWRLYFLVFAGEERSEDAKHAHESPRSMTVPLVVLAGLTVVVGFLGLPHVEAFHSLPHVLPAWLDPVFTHTFTPGVGQTTAPQEILAHHADSTVWILMILATGIGALGIGIAYVFYGKGPSPTVERLVAGPLAGAADASRNKLWVDEAYEKLILGPFRTLARGTYEVLDRFIIDKVVVEGSSMVVSMFSRIAGWVQNGQVQRYLVGIVVGAALVFFLTGRKVQPTFSIQLVDGKVELRARPGEGIAKVGTTYRWDLDGDGAPDLRPGRGPTDFVDDEVVLARPGELGAKVTLWIDGGVSKSVVVTRVIELGKLHDAGAGKPVATSAITPAATATQGEGH